jgi:riboflavin synthase
LYYIQIFSFAKDSLSFFGLKECSCRAGVPGFVVGMFTGIVESTGLVDSLEVTPGGGRLVLTGVGFADDLVLGESVAVNGCCLTVVSSGQGRAAFDLLQETLRLTNLGALAPGEGVNLERALRANDRLSGHFVQGHIDSSADILAYEPDGQDHRLVVQLPEAGQRLVIPKGSITVNGISLTVAALEGDRFTLWITPHTHAVTTLRLMQAGQRVNLEYDFLGKHVERLLSLRGL